MTTPWIAIIGLLFICRPTAIFGEVTLIVIDSINRISTPFWTLPHICYEICKVLPSFAYIQATPSISKVTFMIWIYATLNHSRPSHINFRLSPSRRAVTQSTTTSSRDFLFETAATFYLTETQISRLYFSHVSALALTKPSSTAFLRYARYYGESFKNLSSQVSQWWHNNNIPCNAGVQP
jgi:hypothetical protein